MSLEGSPRQASVEGRDDMAATAPVWQTSAEIFRREARKSKSRAQDKKMASLVH
jgi:hypothetical protein